MRIGCLFGFHTNKTMLAESSTGFIEECGTCHKKLITELKPRYTCLEGGSRHQWGMWQQIEVEVYTFGHYSGLGDAQTRRCKICGKVETKRI